jgi:pimeloyl-ACP methyl ester carboxylesterase
MSRSKEGVGQTEDGMKEQYAREFAAQSERLARLRPGQEDDTTGNTQATEVKFITPHDPIVQTAQGPLPVVPIDEALRLNQLKDRLENREPQAAPRSFIREEMGGTRHGAYPDVESMEDSKESDAPLGESIPQSSTNPLFPPLPMYGPPTLLRTLQCLVFRVTSAVGSFCFLLTIVAGAVFTSIPKVWRRIRIFVLMQNPDLQRPFWEEEKKRAEARKAAEAAWLKRKLSKGTHTPAIEKALLPDAKYTPTEGGPDPLVADIRYYARRVGLDAEVFDVQTEDGFVIDLWHVYDPSEYTPVSPEHRQTGAPNLFSRTQSSDSSFAEAQASYPPSQKKYPVLMMHGLLQSAGAYCCNDDDSMAFWLAKSGYDIWLGNNRCGFNPRHTSLKYGDPRMWAWNIRQMGVMDLPALISRVLAETGFEKLGLIAHSQGTTQTLVALAKEQRPDIGEKISVFCALAPAVYAGPLIGKIYFKIMRVISPTLFRFIFGIHSFIPLMMEAHGTLPGNIYGFLGYLVFSFLLNWSDTRWDRGLRNRMFKFAPVYVSAESMRWWLGRECFAKQKCILATREEGQLEDKEDEEDDEVIRKYYVDREPHVTERRKLQRNLSSFHCQQLTHQHHNKFRAKYSWYNSQFPPLALWVCGADDLVDGRRLLRRFDRGREPEVQIVHKKIIEGYEHLDVLWALDMIEKVGKEVREVIWRTTSLEDRARCRVPTGCEAEIEVHPDDAAGQQRTLCASMSRLPSVARLGGRKRMESISESPDKQQMNTRNSFPPATQMDQTRGEWDEDEQDGPQTDRQKKNSMMREETEEELSEKAEAGEEEGVHALDMAIPEARFTDMEEKANPLG